MTNDLRTAISQAAPGRRGSARANARRALDSCWPVLWKVIEPRIDRVLLDALTPMAKSDDKDESSPAKLVLAREREFRAAYAAECRAEFNRAIADFVTRKVEERGNAKKKSALSLIGYDDMELSTVVERGSARIRNSADDSYSRMKMRLANMVGEPEIRDGDNPLQPAVFFRPLYLALEKANTPAERRLPFMLLLEEPFARLMVLVYDALDNYMAEKGGSDELAPDAWRPTQGGIRTGRNTAAGDPGRGTEMGGPNTLSGGPSTRSGDWNANGVGSAATEQMLLSLYQRLQVFEANVRTGGSGAAAAGHQPPTAAQPGQSAALAGGSLMSMFAPASPVGYAGAGPGAASNGVMAPIVIDANLISAINEIQKLSALALTVAQREGHAPDAAVDVGDLRARLSGKATSEVDKLTIEIVGLVFDRINQDRYVPAEIKKLLQRLQFPMIKVALTDAERFAAAAEAPRQLLDRIASTSIGWTTQGEENRRYLAEVQKAVHQVLASIDGGMTAFARALEDFEAYLNDERTRDDDPVARARRALAEAETHEVMAINAMIRIRGVFEGMQIESYLRDFLLNTWVRVLVTAALADRSANGERLNGEMVRRYLGIVPDLLWSVQPKVQPEDRKRLVSTIPLVLSTLRDGLLMIQWPAPQMQEFFARLMTSHAQAVKAIELAHGASVPVETSTLRIKLDGIDWAQAEMPDSDNGQLHVSDDAVRQVIAANHVDVDHLALPEGALNTHPGAVAVETLDEHIAAFRRGDWFNLRIGNTLERVRLRWVSPRKTLYLFTPADGRRAHSLSPDTLRAFLANGDLLPVEAEPLFARAVHGIVADLQHAAQAAAAG